MPRCATCAAHLQTIKAKDQTIGALTAVIDLYRSGAVGGVNPAMTVAPDVAGQSFDPDTWQPGETAALSALESMMNTDDEEDLAGLLEGGFIDQKQYDKALASIQARRVLSIVPDQA